MFLSLKRLLMHVPCSTADRSTVGIEDTGPFLRGIPTSTASITDHLS